MRQTHILLLCIYINRDCVKTVHIKSKSGSV